MNELYILRCHMYYSQYLTVACVEFQTFIPLKFLLFLTANFCYKWSTEYLLEITSSLGYICNPILWVFSQHFKHWKLQFLWHVLLFFGNRCTLEIYKLCINQVMRNICKGLIPRNHSYPNRLNKESTVLRQN